MTRRTRFYDPPTLIREVPGVAKRRSSDRFDTYTGRADDLVATGLLTRDMFPGQPGLPRCAVVYHVRPRATEPRRSVLGPGSMLVSAAGVDRFSVRLMVGADERAAREASTKAKRAKWEEAAQERYDAHGALIRLAGLMEAPEVQAAFRRAAKKSRPSHLRLVWSAEK